MMTKKTSRTMAQAFDEWMRLYIEDPAAFEAEFRSVEAHKRGHEKRSKATSYGNGCARIFRRLMRGGALVG